MHSDELCLPDNQSFLRFSIASLEITEYVPNIPFIAGLGGEDITAEHINYAIDRIIAQDGKAEKHDTVWLNREVKRK